MKQFVKKDIKKEIVVIKNPHPQSKKVRILGKVKK
tara:strand:+ start:1903 stop:2007 length:105 start_codon:yes stop_codon:yes gene_type:complete